jgi:hypothetical protein
MAKYKFQFETGHVYDGSTEIKVKDFIAEIGEDKITPSLQLTIKACGGQLIPEKLKGKAKKRKVKPVQWPNKEGEK